MHCKKVDSVRETNELEIPQTVITAIQDAFHSIESDPFKNLATEHLQMNYFCNTMGLVVCILAVVYLITIIFFLYHQ